MMKGKDASLLLMMLGIVNAAGLLRSPSRLPTSWVSVAAALAAVGDAATLGLVAPADLAGSGYRQIAP